MEVRLQASLDVLQTHTQASLDAATAAASTPPPQVASDNVAAANFEEALAAKLLAALHGPMWDAHLAPVSERLTLLADAYAELLDWRQSHMAQQHQHHIPTPTYLARLSTSPTPPDGGLEGRVGLLEAEGKGVRKILVKLDQRTKQISAALPSPDPYPSPQ